MREQTSFEIESGVKYVYMKQAEFEQSTGEQKLGEIFKSVEKTRQYFRWTFILTLVFFVLPLLGLVFAIPKIIDLFTDMSSGLL